MQSKKVLLRPEVVTATTSAVCERERLDYWRDVVCKTVVDLDPQPLSDVRFNASLNSVIWDGMSVSRICASAHRVSRLRSATARSGAEVLIFNFVVRGEALVEQDGRTVHLRPGDGAVCDAVRDYKIYFDESFDVVSVRIPRAGFFQSPGRIQSITARSFAVTTQVCPMLFAYAVSFSETASRLGAVSSEKVFHNFGDLLRATVDETVLGVALPLSEYRAATLMRIKDYVERHADNHLLDTAKVAQKLSLSLRYINKLMEAEGLSLSRYIWARRVERAANSLSDPHNKGRTLSDIAMRHGFNDLSHFSHAFRHQFGIPPKDFRAKAQGASTRAR